MGDVHNPQPRRTRARHDPAFAERLLDVQEAARMLSIEVSTLYAWAYQRRIRVVKLGRALRFRLSVLIQLIEDGDRPALRDSA
jgi:excisionase family DNA binding protein